MQQRPTHMLQECFMYSTDPAGPIPQLTQQQHTHMRQECFTFSADPATPSPFPKTTQQQITHIPLANMHNAACLQLVGRPMRLYSRTKPNKPEKCFRYKKHQHMIEAVLLAAMQALELNHDPPPRVCTMCDFV
jgi:hypothetical protein